MTKKEIQKRLRAQHIQHWNSTMEWIGSQTERETRDIMRDPVFDLRCMQLNTILESARILGVDIGRAEANTFMVNMVRTA